MEVVQKLVAVALVSMVTSADGLQNCFGINLGMAAACAMVQAYARPQVRLYPNQVVVATESMSAVSVLSFRAFTRCHFTPQWVLQIFGFAPSLFSWPVWWCLCLPSFSQFTVAPYRPLSCVDNFWFSCLPLTFGVFHLFESCKCLVFDAGKVVNVSVITNAEDHQVNLLQSFCFLCLALATLSFHYGWVWSSRAAFALPFVVTAVQGLRPDSPETLALRLWQDTDELVGKFGEWLNSRSP